MDERQYLLAFYEFVLENDKDATGALFSIIQIKKDKPHLTNEKQSLYLDIIQFSDYYIKSIHGKNYGYDLLDSEKLIRAIEIDSDVDERIELYNRIIQKLKKEGFSRESKKMKSIQKRTIIIKMIKSKKINNIFLAIVYFCCYNLWTVLCSFLTILLSYFFITLPLSNEDNCLFLLQYENYSDLPYYNHFLNLLGDILEYNDMNFCKPIHPIGLIILLIFKLLFVTPLAGIFLKYLGDKLKLNEYYE